MRIFHHPLLHFRSAVAMGKSGKLAAASSGPVVAKYRLTFHLHIPLSTDLVISGDTTLRNISSGCANAPAAPSEYGGLARLYPSARISLTCGRRGIERILLFPSLRHRRRRRRFRLRRGLLFVFRFDGWWLMGRFISAAISGP